MTSAFIVEVSTTLKKKKHHEDNTPGVLFHKNKSNITPSTQPWPFQELKLQEGKIKSNSPTSMTEVVNPICLSFRRLPGASSHFCMLTDLHQSDSLLQSHSKNQKSKMHVTNPRHNLSLVPKSSSKSSVTSWWRCCSIIHPDVGRDLRTLQSVWVFVYDQPPPTPYDNTDPLNQPGTDRSCITELFDYWCSL